MILSAMYKAHGKQEDDQMQVCTMRVGKLGSMLVTLALAILPLALIVFLLTAAAPAGNPVQAAVGSELNDWVIVVGTTGTVSLVNATTDIVYGPVLSGELGSSGGGIFDVSVTPDGETALISNFGDSTVYLVDVSNPISPSVITSVTIPFFAEDTDITRDGQYALVTDGGFSSRIAVISLISRTLAYTVELGTAQAQAVDIAPDGTVIVADYWNGSVHSLFPDSSGQLTVTGSYSYTIDPDGTVTATDHWQGSMPVAPFDASGSWIGVAEDGSLIGDSGSLNVGPALAEYVSRPLNVGIAPDGQTVIVCDVAAYDPPTNTLFAAGVYRITSPGVLTLTGVITGLNRATQSVAFSAIGDKAYLSQNGGKTAEYQYNHLAVLDITAPGVVSLDRATVADYPRLTSSQLFGVDTIVVANGKAYVGYPTLSGASYDLRVVDLDDYGVRALSMPGIPVGVAVIPVHKVYLPLYVSPDGDSR